MPLRDPQKFCAENFTLIQGELLGPPKQSSARDYRLQIRLSHYQAWQPGQFVMLRWEPHIIGRPFAILSWEKGPKGTSVLEVWIRQLGAATIELFSKAHKGMPIWATLPLGETLPKPVLQSSKPMLFISGGVGAASLWPLFRARKNKLDRWIHGERSLSDWDKTLPVSVLALEEKPSSAMMKNIKARLQCWTLGRVTAAISAFREQAKFSHALVCGPTPMMEAVGLELRQSWTPEQLKIYVGLEEKMACGLGLCFSCSVLTTDGMRRCCSEGPWFDFEKIPQHFEFRKGALK
jgi:dihydroorotate dehydrogenase electron transfer subunit